MSGLVSLTSHLLFFSHFSDGCQASSLVPPPRPSHRPGIAPSAHRPPHAYCDDWKTNGNETSTEPPDGAGKRQRAMSDLMQLATSASPRVSCSTSTPETVPACVMVQWITIFPLRLGLRLRPRS